MQPPSIHDPAAIKAMIDQHLRAFFGEQIARARQMDERYVLLWQQIEQLMSAGGKRLRPYMLFGVFSAYDTTGRIDDIVSAGLAQELLHAAMLIHDDIIDRDTLRYGTDNISGRYDKLYAEHLPDTHERHHMALSAALLAGDVLISEAYVQLQKTARPSEQVVAAQRLFAEGVFEVIGGELMDTEVTFLPSGTVSAETIARYKTASYSFIGPLTIGATLAGAPEREVALLRQFATQLGVAYQLCDDLLGVFGDEQVTGKSASSDIAEGKRTMLIERFDAQASDEQKEQFYALFHRDDLSDTELQQARQLLVESGARSALEQEISRYREALEAVVEQLAVSETTRKFFAALSVKCIERDR